MDLLIALLPLFILITLVVFLRKSITFAVSVSLLFLLASVAYWGTELSTVAGSSVRGLFLAIEIIVIIFSAVLIFEILERNNLFKIILQLLSRISSDRVVQSLFVLLGVVPFMEGVAGFGTPAIIAIPLLLSIGFSPLQSVVLALVADSIPVSFGAIGLPITFGVGSVVNSIGDAGSGLLIERVILNVAGINILGYLLLVVIILFAIKKFLKLDSIKEYLLFGILSALSIGFVSFATAVYLGPELASIIGGVGGMLAVVLFAKLNHFKNKFGTKSSISADLHLKPAALIKAILPYSLLVFLLLLTRLPSLEIGELLSNFKISIDSIFGGSVSYEIAPLVSAAIILLAVAVFSLFWFSESLEQTKSVVKDVLKLVYKPFIALSVTLIFVQIFINSESSQLQSMPIIIAQNLSSLVGGFWPLFNPSIGVLGSFLSGSATVSNLIFSGIQYDIAVQTFISPSVVLSLQSVGAALGNMIALHNIVAALAIAKLHSNSTHEIIRQNGAYLAILAVAVSVLGLIIVNI